MKKILSLALVAIMALTLFTGCSNPVYDDFQNFLNVEMVEVNENYSKITAEAGTWENFEDLAQMEKSVTEVMLPLVNASLEKLSAINPATEEVQEIKAKYVKVMETYKAGFDLILEAVKTESEEKMNEGSAKINTGIEYLNEYNAALEALASEVGAEIEY